MAELKNVLPKTEKREEKGAKEKGDGAAEEAQEPAADEPGRGPPAQSDDEDFEDFDVARRDSLIIMQGLEAMVSDDAASESSEEGEFDLSKLIDENSARLSISRSRKQTPSPNPDPDGRALMLTLDDPSDGPNSSRQGSAVPSPGLPSSTNAHPPPSLEKPPPDPRTLSLAVVENDDENKDALPFDNFPMSPGSPKPGFRRSNGRPIPQGAHVFSHSTSKERYMALQDSPRKKDEKPPTPKTTSHLTEPVDLRHCCSDASYKTNSCPTSPVNHLPTPNENKALNLESISMKVLATAGV